MAIYLGRNKVSPMFVKMIEKTITTDNQGNEIITYNTNTNFVDNDPDDLSYERDTVYETWLRPNDWPNLDAIDIPDTFEGVYLTYKNTADLPYRIACFICNTSNNGVYKIEVGHLNSSNVFVADITNANAAGNGSYVLCDYSSISSTTYPYIIIRITPSSTSLHLTGVRFGRIPVGNTGTIVQANYYHNFCVERRGRLPYAVYFAYSSSNYGYMTYYMEKDATIIGTASHVTGTNFVGAFAQGVNLRVIDFTGWDTSNWTITSLSEVFRYCYNLLQLNLNMWDTSHWAITSLSYLFALCCNLKNTGIENWVTNNWAVTTLLLTWYCNFRLETLELERWNTSNWAVTSLADTWSNCYALNNLAVSTWDTSNWRVSSLSSTWYSCYQLISIDLSGWSTTNWAVTTLASTWNGNLRRRDFHDIENWVTSNWVVTSLASTWANCISIVSLNLNKWNTDKWKVTNFTSTWSGCRKLKELHISNWNVNGISGNTTYTGWAPTSLASTWYNCCRLEENEAFKWNITKAWAITSLNSTFRYCYSLKEVDFKNWNVSSYNITDIAGFTSDCRSLKTLSMEGKNSTDIALNITTANNYGTTSNSGATTILYNCHSLTVFNPPSNWTGRIYLSTAYSLSRDELIKFINNLSTAIASDTGIVIGAQRYKLFTSDLNVATNTKGYSFS